jgi:hypothetical protein
MSPPTFRRAALTSATRRASRDCPAALGRQVKSQDFQSTAMAGDRLPRGHHQGGSRAAARYWLRPEMPHDGIRLPCRLDGDYAVFVIGYDKHGQVNGFLHNAACPADPCRSRLCHGGGIRQTHSPHGSSPRQCRGRAVQERRLIAPCECWQPETGQPGADSLPDRPFAGGRHRPPRRTPARPTCLSRP